MDDTLFKAILSMDAYNRGYDAGIKFGNGTGTNSDDSIGTLIGSASIFATRGQEDAQNIGFYALAYSYNGETIISYRGTNDVDGVPNPVTDLDVYHGWSLGLGNIDSEQGAMAITFYKAIAEQTELPGSTNVYLDSNISLTGHSLGGGLAGAIAGLYDQQAHIFDSMDYIAALINFYGATSDPQSSSYDAATKALIYGSATPWTQNPYNVNAWHLEGEALGFVRLPTSTEVGLGAEVNLVSGPDAIARHDMASLVIAMFGEDPALGTSWQSAAPYFWPVMNVDDFSADVRVFDTYGYIDNMRDVETIVLTSGSDTVIYSHAVIPNVLTINGGDGDDSFTLSADTSFGYVQRSGDTWNFYDSYGGPRDFCGVGLSARAVRLRNNPDGGAQRGRKPQRSHQTRNLNSFMRGSACPQSYTYI